MDLDYKKENNYDRSTACSAGSLRPGQFIKDNQEAFNYGALEEFGQRDDHFEEDGEIISHDTIAETCSLPRSNCFFSSRSKYTGIGKIVATLEPADMASEEHIEMYRTLHPEED